MNSHQCDVVGMSCQVGCLVQDTHAILGSSCTHGAVPAFCSFVSPSTHRFPCITLRSTFIKSSGMMRDRHKTHFSHVLSRADVICLVRCSHVLIL